MLSGDIRCATLFSELEKTATAQSSCHAGTRIILELRVPVDWSDILNKGFVFIVTGASLMKTLLVKLDTGKFHVFMGLVDELRRSYGVVIRFSSADFPLGCLRHHEKSFSSCRTLRLRSQVSSV